MWRARSPVECLSLETQAAFAGLALGCAYSGSDEFEASVIAQRRNAGANGHGQRHLVVAAAATAAALLFFIAF